jgi:hypothetical protein
MPPRRSFRLKANLETNASATIDEGNTDLNNELEDHDATIQSQEVNVEERPKKRSKHKNTKDQDIPEDLKTKLLPLKRTKGMVGKLKALPGMPIDILHEVRHSCACRSS